MVMIMSHNDARILLRDAITRAYAGESRRELDPKVENEIANLLVKVESAAIRDTNVEAQSKHEKSMDVVFGLVNSARINMESAWSYRHLQKHDPQALSNDDWGIDKYVREAIIDLTKAGDADDRIPF